MLRKIIKIDEEKCNGCGVCAESCHESAIEIVDGKARLIREDYCDGLGNCLPVCPTDAISFEEREAPAFDAEAVREAQQKKEQENAAPFACPGMQVKSVSHDEKDKTGNDSRVPSRLSQWPVQIRLLPTQAPYFEGADLLIAADCTAYAYGNFHNDFIRDHAIAIGCPKLDEEDYADALTQIIAGNAIKSVTVVRMEVPCCGGLEYAARQALEASGKDIPFKVEVISIDGKRMG